MLYAEQKPRLAIFSIAHLDDAERMFFVTLLLNEVLAWIRTQPGTSSLRALLYMDEVFGYFPPLGNPPAKRPMLTLLKQARAYGLGCVLATQNPVDLDYKGLSNAGTWFLGRLQTERDKARVIEGLEGASAQAGSNFDRQKMEAMLAALGNRVFLMNNVHEDAPVVFQTRWAMSYLCGPLTRGQIKTLMDPMRGEFASTISGASGSTVTTEGETAAAGVAGRKSGRTIVPSGVREEFAAIRERVPDGFRLEYRPALVGMGKVHFVRKGDDVDVWRECFLLQASEQAPADDIWDGAELREQPLETEKQPDDLGDYAALPSEWAREKSYAIFARHLKEHLYREESLKLWKCAPLDATSKPGEGEPEFRQRLAPMLAAKRDAERGKLEAAHAKKLADVEERIRKAQARVSTQRWQFFARLGSMLWVVVDTVMSALGKGLPGRRRSLDPAFRSAATERGQQSNAKIALASVVQDKEMLEKEHAAKLQQLNEQYDAAKAIVEKLELKPQKSDIEIDKVALVWLPWRVDGAGKAEAVY
jgi:hypothetical protein